MAIISMTGYGEARGSLERAGAPSVNISVELRTVNHRFLDVNVKLPQAYSRFENDVVRLIRSELKRGRVDVVITRCEAGQDQLQTKFDEAAFGVYLAITKKALKIAGLEEKTALPIALPNILFRREVLEISSGEQDVSEEWGTLELLVRQATTRLTEMRCREGDALERELLGQLEMLRQLGKGIKAFSEQAPTLFQERLRGRLERLNAGIEIDPQRLAQEVAILADRVDVTEELVRLQSHLDQFAQIISQGEGGRKLEFLLQEIGREINTTGSKSQQSEITKLVVEGKSVVEKIREQVLNIE